MLTPAAALYFPASQLVQTVEPAAAAYLPAGQGRHEALPAASLYVPVHQRAASRVVSACFLSLLEVKKA